MDWSRRMRCQLCGGLIADHPWPGGMHDEMIGMPTARRKGFKR